MSESQTLDLAVVATAQAGTPNLTMTSREIADLVGTRHNDLIGAIERQIDQGILRVRRENRRPLKTEGRGRPIDVYDLEKRDVLIVASGYDDARRARIVDRLLELEAAQRAAPRPAFDPSDPRVILQVVGALQSRVQEQETLIAEQRQDVEKLRRIEGAKGSFCITDAAKMLKVRRVELISRLQAHRWIYKRPGSKTWLAYDAKRQAGYMEHDDHIYQDSAGQERVATRALVTAKGLVKLAEILNQPLQ